MEQIPGSARLSSDVRSQQLITYINSLENDLRVLDGVLYYDYPLFRDADDVLYRSKVLLASRTHGVLIFSIPDIAEREYSKDAVALLDEDLSQLSSIIYGKLIKSRVLRKSVRELRTPLDGLIVLADFDTHGAVLPEHLENTVVNSLGNVREWIAEHRSEEHLDEEAWDELRSTLEGAKGLVRPKERDLRERAPNSKPVILAQLEMEVANFDANQRRAAISIVDGPQRIRGLAGSGKTIVLAMKAAHLHLNDPQTEILFTFYTKSLYSFLKRLVTRFYRQFNDRDPDWTKIHIRHAWGGRTVEGVYSSASLDAQEPALTLSEVASKGGFDYACTQLMATGKVMQRYDYTLMDEAQDFPGGFFKLCFALTRGGAYDRNVVWAYDELQNIMNVRMKSPKDLFGTDASGVALIDLERAAQGTIGSHDIVLHKCYRNPREVLLTAHALGFGIYSDTPVQMLENCEHWEDVGYQVEKGSCRPGQHTMIFRPAENSPLSISNVQTPEQLIECYKASDFSDEVAWVAQRIVALVNEGLRPDDIMIIALDDRSARTYFRGIAAALLESDIRVNDLLSDPYTAPAFAIEDHVTLTTVYRAKGNEAPLVFATGIEALFPVRRMQRGRNKIFTAFTRAKGWLRVSGIGDEAQFFFDEISRALAKFPRLEFTYPDPNTIITLQRDLSDRASKMRKLQEQLNEQLEMLGLDENEKVEFLSTFVRRKR